MSKKGIVSAELVAQETIEGRILLIRGKKVMLDADLAWLYGVTTKRLNEQVKRNLKRFPEDFMFKLTRDEKLELVAKCDRFARLKHSSASPHAFTEQGVAMLSSVLHSDRAIQVNIQIMRTFTRLRQMLFLRDDLRGKIEEMESRYDHHFRVVFRAIKELVEPVSRKPKRRIGFH